MERFLEGHTVITWAPDTAGWYYNFNGLTKGIVEQRLIRIDKDTIRTRAFHIWEKENLPSDACWTQAEIELEREAVSKKKVHDVGNSYAHLPPPHDDDWASTRNARPWTDDEIGAIVAIIAFLVWIIGVLLVMFLK